MIVRYLLVLMTIVFLIMIVLECLWVTKEANLALNIPVTIPIIIVEFITVVIELVMI